jgi:hypothetical protein
MTDDPHRPERQDLVGPHEIDVLEAIHDAPDFTDSLLSLPRPFTGYTNQQARFPPGK